MKKWIVIPIVAVLVIVSLICYFILSGGNIIGSVFHRTVEADGFRIEVQRAYMFEEWIYAFDRQRPCSKGLIIEMKLENIGDIIQIMGPLDGYFYIKDTQGKKYLGTSATFFCEWEYEDGLKQVPSAPDFASQLVEPGESLKFQIWFVKEYYGTNPWDEPREKVYPHNFPESLEGLELTYIDNYSKIHTIPLDVEISP